MLSALAGDKQEYPLGILASFPRPSSSPWHAQPHQPSCRHLGYHFWCGGIMLPGSVDFCGSAVLESSQPLCLPTFPFPVSLSCGTAALTHGRDFLVFPWCPSASVALALLLNADFWGFLSRSTHDFLFFLFLTSLLNLGVHIMHRSSVHPRGPRIPPSSLLHPDFSKLFSSTVI